MHPNPSRFLKESDMVPPFLLCALAKHGGKQVSFTVMQELTGWSRCTVIRAYRSTTWADWSLRDMVQLHSALKLHHKKLAGIRRDVAGGLLDLSHIKTKHCRKQVMRRLAALFTKLARERQKHAG